MSVASALALALLHSVWQVACLAGVAWLLHRRLRTLGPRVSYAIHFSALMLAGLAFIATFVSELWAPGRAGAVGEEVAAYAARSPAALFPLLAVVLWSMGAAFMSVRLLWAWASLQRLRARATGLGGDLRERLDLLRARLGVRRPVDLLESSDVDGPVTLGWLRPCVLLPVGLATGLRPEVLEAALAHELAHVGRRDFIANLANRSSRSCCSITRQPGGCLARSASSGSGAAMTGLRVASSIHSNTRGHSLNSRVFVCNPNQRAASNSRRPEDP